MRVSLFPLVSVCLFASIATFGQQVIEDRSSVTVTEGFAVVRLAVSDPRGGRTVQTRAEFIDTNDTVRSATPVETRRLTRGLQFLEFRLPLAAHELSEDGDISWYRLRYRVGNAFGTIAMSSLTPDLFELRIITPESVAAGSRYRVRVLALNPFTSKPVGGVNIIASAEIDLDREDDDDLEITGTTITDGSGFAVLDFAIPADSPLDGDAELTVRGRKNGFERKASADLDTLDNASMFLMMADKPIYQPEQSVNVRGLLMQGTDSQTIVAGAEIEFRIRDEDNTLLFRERVTTSAFGVAHMSWQIPANAKLGNYYIEARGPDGRDAGEHSVRITRYDLPNFVVNAKGDRDYYLPANRYAEIEVHADYLFGKPVARGRVRIVEEKSREWSWREQKYVIDEGVVLEGELGADGSFKASYDLAAAHASMKPERRWQQFKDIQFAAYVTDASTNRTEQRRFDLRVTPQPIHLYWIPADRSSHPEMPITGYVSAFYPDGTPAECVIDVEMRPGRSESFQRVGTVKTNSLGAGKLVVDRTRYKHESSSNYVWLSARDGNGNRATFENDFYAYNDNDVALNIVTDRTIYKPGESVRVSVTSTQRSGTVYLDVLSGFTVIDSYTAELRTGRAELSIPYSAAFAGQVTIGAFIEEDDDNDDEVVAASRGVIFPAKSGLNVSASFDKAVYKPNEEAKLSLGVLDTLGNALESALGIVIVDQAVNERARTDSEFGGYFGRLGRWLGYGAQFGSINVKDLNELDLAKPISPELQLVAEILLRDTYYRPSISRSDGFDLEARAAFSAYIEKQFTPLKKILDDAYAKDNDHHPVDDASLIKFAGQEVAADRLSDPWGLPYRRVYSVAKDRNVSTFRSAGADKRFDTDDDFNAYSMSYAYFPPTGRKIDAAVKDHFERTGQPIRNRENLLAELGIQELNDRYGRPYLLDFVLSHRHLNISVKSAGPDGKPDNRWGSDDFSVWTSRTDLFADTELKIRQIQFILGRVPRTESEFRAGLLAGGVNLDEVRDAYGRPVYLTERQFSRRSDRSGTEIRRDEVTGEKFPFYTVTPVTQGVIVFTLRSTGADGIRGTRDDANMASFEHVLTEQGKDDPKPVPVFDPVRYSKNAVPLSGRVTDPNGSVIPGAEVTAQSASANIVRTTETNAAGRFAFASLPAGEYTLSVSADGFNRTIITGIQVNASSSAEINVVLEIGGISEMVTVTAGREIVNRSSASIAQNVTESQVMALPLNTRDVLSLVALQPGVAAGARETSTPRLREYFPETLLWRPEVITDSNGRAEVTFRMADNITTWKMYTIASTRDGKIGVATGDAVAFQSFFVDLDPPKFLTVGDEIHLPTQVRNYTNSTQNVDVTMADANWFSFIGDANKTVDVASGATENAVFGFRATTVAKDNKQRVTAIAAQESDAIEKPVTVRPDGHEVTASDTRFFKGETGFDVAFPEHTLAGTQTAELKIYPNLMAHVTESVEGLLQRPYGCGEQTISSTYPNLMILKFAAEGEGERLPAATVARARKNLQTGYERLAGYQTASGGFSYWGSRDAADLALTAYAVRFLADAREHVVLDPAMEKRARAWLVSQQRQDGSWNVQRSWETSQSDARAKRLTTYIARVLAMAGDSAQAGDALPKALAFLHARNREIDDPYSLALLGLAYLDAGRKDEAAAVAKRVAALATVEGSAKYWNLESNTVFYGWGLAGRIETTALVTQLLVRTNDAEGSHGGLISDAMLFLLKNKDRYGVWYSTQTTINVLDTFLSMLATEGEARTQNVEVLINGVPAETIEIGPDKLEQIVVNLNGGLDPIRNRVELKSSGPVPMMAGVVQTHYVPWQNAEITARNVNESRAVTFDYRCDRTTVEIMQEVTCTVAAERVGFRGYGMLLAEVGIPPGADVSRESLEAAMGSGSSISKYEVLPDRLIIYMWAVPGGSRFDFNMRPRYGINAQTPASFAYDYYNPEARATVAPLRFIVR